MVEILTKTTKGLSKRYNFRKKYFDENKVLDFYIDSSFILVSFMLTFMFATLFGIWTKLCLLLQSYLQLTS